MKTQIVIAELKMQLAGEYKHFELRIPDNVIHIKAVETSIRFTSDLWTPIENSTHKVLDKKYALCDLRLQGGKFTTWYYATTLHECVTDYRETNSEFEQNLNCFQPIRYNKKRESDSIISTPIGSRIKGYCKDILGATLQKNLHYTITICIHLNTA